MEPGKQTGGGQQDERKEYDEEQKTIRTQMQGIDEAREMIRWRAAVVGGKMKKKE